MKAPYGGMCCEVCGIGVAVTAMHRANPKGEKGRWRCAPCLERQIDPVVLGVTDAAQLGVDPRTLDNVHVAGQPPPCTPTFHAWVDIDGSDPYCGICDESEAHDNHTGHRDHLR